ncbi:MAG: hypothetical protein HT579_16325 [Candidatus Accumulibacter similis]|nr:MAG: hypothetical protein HT579_16325 [Candidatus Accumulibacter similis]
MKSLSSHFIAALVAVSAIVAGRLPVLDEVNSSLVAARSAIVAGVPALLAWSRIGLLETFRSRASWAPAGHARRTVAGEGVALPSRA